MLSDIITSATLFSRLLSVLGKSEWEQLPDLKRAHAF